MRIDVDFAKQLIKDVSKKKWPGKEVMSIEMGDKLYIYYREKGKLIQVGWIPVRRDGTVEYKGAK